MKKVVFLLGLILCSFHASGQRFDKLLYSKKSAPTVLINKRIIANAELISSLPEEKLKNVQFIRPSQNVTDEYAKLYPNLTQYGLILCEIEPQIVSARTPQELRRFLNVDDQTKIYIDGYLLKNESYTIAVQSMKEIELIDGPDEGYAHEKIISIWTLSRDMRLGDATLRFNRRQPAENSARLF